MGAAWGAPIAGVEVRIDDGPWQPATLTEGEGEAFAWGFWTLDWGTPAAGRAHRHLAGHRRRRRCPAGAGRPVHGQQETYWESNGQITRRVRIA